MSRIGDLTVRVGADISDLRRGLDGATGRVQGFRRAIAPMVKTMAAVGAAATAAAVGVAAFTKSGMDAIDAQAKLARQLDSTIGGLRGLQLASEDAGVATGVINSAMERFSARLGEAQRGAGQAKDALDRLGLSASNLAGMDVDERMAAIADRVQQLGLSGAETADILRQFGIRNREIVNLLRQGGDAIRDARQEIEDYGLAVDAVDAGAIEAANDALSRVGLVMESVRNALSQELAPIILVIARRFNESARQAGGMGEIVGDVVASSIESIGHLLDALEGIRRGFVVGGQSAALFALTVDKWMSQAEVSIRNKPLQAIADLVEGLSELPGLAFLGGSPLALFANTLLVGRESAEQELKTLEGAVDLAIQDMNETLETPMPSDWVDSLLRDARDAKGDIESSIKDVADIQLPRLSGGGDSSGGTQGGQSGEEEEGPGRFMGGPGLFGDDEQTQAYLERLRTMMEVRNGILREYDSLEVERQQEQFETDMERLKEALDLEAITEEEYRQAALERERRFAAEKYNIRQNSESGLTALVDKFNNEQVSSYATAFDSILNSMATYSRAAFNIQKGLAIANAVVKGYEAVVGAYAWGANIGGPPLGAAMAAAAGAATFAQIQNIRSQQFGGGGSSASGSVSTGGASGGTGGDQPAQPEAPSGGTLTVEGISSSSLFTGDAVRELAEELIDYQKRGGQVVIQ